MRFLIVGATGAVGYYQAKFLKEAGETVYGIGRKPVAGEVAKYLDVYSHPINLATDNEKIARALKNANPEVIIHLAGIANVKRCFAEPELFLANNVGGTLNLFHAIAESGLKPKVVLASSSEIYGNVPQIENPIREEQPHNPCSPYAVTKSCQEHYANCYSMMAGFPLVITRAFGYINPRRPDLVATSLAYQLVQFSRGDTDVIEHGDLSPVRTFCDVRDIVKAYYLAATKCGPGVYNIGSEEPCSIQRIADELRRIVPVYAEWHEKETLRRPTDVFYAVPDCDKFCIETGWTAKIGLTESLEWLVDELKAVNRD